MVKKGHLDDPLAFLEKKWPGRRSQEVKKVFSLLKKKLAKQAIPSPKSAKKEKPTPAPCLAKGEPFNILDLIRQTCSALDLLFLSRQIIYHISASSNLSYVFADSDQTQSVLSELLRHIVKRSPHGGRIDISLNEVTTRNGKGVEIALKGVDEKSAGLTRTTLIKHFFGEEPSGKHSSIFSCREAVVKQGGQLTLDLPQPKHVVFCVTLPTVIAPQVTTSEQQTFKYDITIKNIANVRKRFGIKKSHVLVTQVENYVRSLIRHPIDIVMSAPDKGVITTIYETPRGSAQSVASRISHRLGSEEFRVGKKPVELNFGYHLSLLPPSQLNQTSVE